ncbi:hypothetical protein ACOI1A_00970 [Corynebacterium glutamicum]|uniref:hypothetical protein n=1 Tax=Corynebacterium glutamicum TaxID=1718 RepID=UPI003B5A6524
MAAAAKKTNSTKPEIIENDVLDDEFVDTVETIDSTDAGTTPVVTPEKVETIEIDVTLANGAELTLEVIKDQNDWAYEAVEAMSEMNYAVLINAIITRTSKLKLKMAGAKVRDFEMITEKVTGALGSVKSESDTQKK